MTNSTLHNDDKLCKSLYKAHWIYHSRVKF